MGVSEIKLRKTDKGTSLSVPKGYVPICVGKSGNTCKCFMVLIRALGDAYFCELLGGSEEEYGFRNEGILKIPFEARDFEEWLMGKSNNGKIVSKRRVKPT
ncbi:hypothetical protein Fmac_010822 [Flemingia macrophylla]|uniref:Uncharacterized protein n=1 Tax=Flemingia macrophylla TaxID=520843 RepID=A0ABD1MKZ3_9FABA